MIERLLPQVPFVVILSFTEEDGISPIDIVCFWLSFYNFFVIYTKKGPNILYNPYPENMTCYRKIL